MLPHFDRMVEHCLAMLDEQHRDGRCACSALHVRMHLVPGQTMRAFEGGTLESHWLDIEVADEWTEWHEAMVARNPQRLAQPGLFT
jgi:hypothetical protein